MVVSTVRDEMVSAMRRNRDDGVGSAIRQHRFYPASIAGDSEQALARLPASIGAAYSLIS